MNLNWIPANKPLHALIYEGVIKQGTVVRIQYKEHRFPDPDRLKGIDNLQQEADVVETLLVGDMGVKGEYGSDYDHQNDLVIEYAYIDYTPERTVGEFVDATQYVCIKGENRSKDTYVVYHNGEVVASFKGRHDGEIQAFNLVATLTGKSL